MKGALCGHFDYPEEETNQAMNFDEYAKFGIVLKWRDHTDLILGGCKENAHFITLKPLVGKNSELLNFKHSYSKLS